LHTFAGGHFYLTDHQVAVTERVAHAARAATA